MDEAWRKRCLNYAPESLPFILSTDFAVSLLPFHPKQSMVGVGGKFQTYSKHF